MGFVELSQRGREKGQSSVIMLHLKVFWLPGKALFFFNLLFPSLRARMMTWTGRGKENAAAKRMSKREREEAAIFRLGEGWNHVENEKVML